MFVSGLLLFLNVEATRAYGPVVVNVGLAFVVLAVLTVLTALCGIVGSRGHNKFCLLIYILFSTSIFVFQVLFGSKYL